MMIRAADRHGRTRLQPGCAGMEAKHKAKLKQQNKKHGGAKKVTKGRELRGKKARDGRRRFRGEESMCNAMRASVRMSPVA